MWARLSKSKGAHAHAAAFAKHDRSEGDGLQGKGTTDRRGGGGLVGTVP